MFYFKMSHFIENHQTMTAEELNLSPDIIIRYDMRPKSVEERLDEYRSKMRQAIKSGHGVTCEMVSTAATQVVSEQVDVPNDISSILRGAK
jgi:hypothetical protein